VPYAARNEQLFGTLFGGRNSNTTDRKTASAIRAELIGNDCATANVGGGFGRPRKAGRVPR
jgi:hypothetical protein